MTAPGRDLLDSLAESPDLCSRTPSESVFDRITVARIIARGTTERPLPWVNRWLARRCAVALPREAASAALADPPSAPEVRRAMVGHSCSTRRQC